MSEPIRAVSTNQPASTAQASKAVTAKTAGTAATEALGPQGKAPTDAASLSDEATTSEAEDGEDNPLLKALKGEEDTEDTDKAKDPKKTDDTKDTDKADDKKDTEAEKQEKIKQLQKEIQQTEDELQKALDSGDEAGAKAASGRLSTLVQQLQGLMGDKGTTAPDVPGDEAIQAATGAAAPADGGGAAAPAGDFGGGAAPAGGGGGGAPVAGGAEGATAGGEAPAAAQDTAGAAETQTVPPELSADDEKLAQFIETQLEGSPAAGKGLGAHFVAAGRKNDVDPLALVAIAKHETGYGKLGVGLTKMLGVGAYDSNPNGKTEFDGAVNQIYSGAKTFANLRAKGGSTSKDSLGTQLAAVNKAGWATDQSWHTKVASHYNNIAANANKTKA